MTCYSHVKVLRTFYFFRFNVEKKIFATGNGVEGGRLAGTPLPPPPSLHFSTALYTCVNINIFEENWVNMKCNNPVNTAAFEIELHVFKQAFQENASHFDNIWKFYFKRNTTRNSRNFVIISKSYDHNSVVTLNPATIFFFCS